MPAARVTSANNTVGPGDFLATFPGTCRTCACCGDAVVTRNAAPSTNRLTNEFRRNGRKVSITGLGRWPFLRFGAALFSIPRSVAILPALLRDPQAFQRLGPTG